MRWRKEKTAFTPAEAAGNFYRTGSAINHYARLVGLLAGLVLFLSASAQQTDPAPDPLQPQYTQKGAGKCLLCHSELRMELMTETPHGDHNNPDAPFGQHDCESCHGPGSFHVSRSRRGKGRPPMITFGKEAKTPVEQQVQVCLGCHAKNRAELLKIKGHENATEVEGITCSNCHTVHLLPPSHEQEAAALSSALAAVLQQPTEYTEKGPQDCLLCHAEMRMTEMADTPHGDKSNLDTPFAQHGCESCHGQGSLHISRSMRGKGRPAMITFGKQAKTPLPDQIQVCVQCHGKDREKLLKMAGHKNAKSLGGLSCSTCHTLHPFPNDGSGKRSPVAEYTERGPEKCLLCHTEARVKRMADTPHGNKSNPQTPFAQHGCESCHGEGSLHVARSIRGKERPAMITFGERAKTSLDDQIQTCLQCHGKDRDELLKISGHKNAKTLGGLSCSSCHTMHPYPSDGSAQLSPLAEYTEQGPEICLLCHSNERIDLVLNSAHGDATNPHTPFALQGCENCHGKGSLHVSQSRRGKGRPPMIAFGEGKHTSLSQQTEVCLGCHSQEMGTLPAVAWDTTAHSRNATCISCHQVHVEGELAAQAREQTRSCAGCHAEGIGGFAAMEWQDSVHDQQALSCSNCHAIHTEGNPLLDKQVQANTCFSCHEDRATEHPRFEDKFIDFDSLSCSTCHDVHQLIPQHQAGASTSVQGAAIPSRTNE
jgi:predicted CXXCH cytochrome family protein